MGICCRCPCGAIPTRIRRHALGQGRSWRPVAARVSQLVASAKTTPSRRLEVAPSKKGARALTLRLSMTASEVQAILVRQYSALEHKLPDNNTIPAELLQPPATAQDEDLEEQEQEDGVSLDNAPELGACELRGARVGWGVGALESRSLRHYNSWPELKPPTWIVAAGMSAPPSQRRARVCSCCA